jgi:hypothetical protein
LLVLHRINNFLGSDYYFCKIVLSVGLCYWYVYD